MKAKTIVYFCDEGRTFSHELSGHISEKGIREFIAYMIRYLSAWEGYYKYIGGTAKMEHPHYGEVHKAGRRR